MQISLKIKRLTSSAVLPKYAKPGDAGFDLTSTSYSFENGRHIYGTGLSMEIPPGHVGLIFPRSSIMKYDMSLSNSVGVIDSGYRGEIKIVFTPIELEKWMDDPVIYKVGERIAQMIILPYPEIEFIDSEELSSSSRGEGGFGSSGC